MRPVRMKVGELAKQTGVSVRTLHYYDEIGLLTPTHHTDAGYRLYGADEIARLQQIKSLRQLGFSLDEIRGCLRGPDFSPQRVIALHLVRIREQIDMQHRLCDRLEGIARRLQATESVSVEDFLQTIGAMSMVEKYYTSEQREWLKQRRETVGEERIRAVEAEWPQLIAKVRDAMDAGTDPADPQVQALAQRWKDLIAAFTGGDPGIEQSLSNMYKSESPQDIHPSLDPRMREYGEYIGKAMAAKKNVG